MLKELNDRIETTVTRTADGNRIAVQLPTTGLPGSIAGIQFWASNSPYALLQTCAAGTECFTSRSYTHSGDGAEADTRYLATMYFGASEALGLFTASSAPDTAAYPGTAADGGDDGPGGGFGDLPTWAIVLIVLGVLFLIVLVVILVARGRGQQQEQAPAPGSAWEGQDEAKAANAEWGAGATGEVHQARCPACATSFTATGTKPIVTVCPGCGKKGILR